MVILTDHELRVLEFAQARANGSKAHPIDAFGWRETTYVIELRKLLARPEVVADPRWTVLLRRIESVHEEQRRVRASRRFAPRLPHEVAS